MFVAKWLASGIYRSGSISTEYLSSIQDSEFNLAAASWSLDEIVEFPFICVKYTVMSCVGKYKSFVR